MSVSSSSPAGIRFGGRWRRHRHPRWLSRRRPRSNRRHTGTIVRTPQGIIPRPGSVRAGGWPWFPPPRHRARRAGRFPDRRSERARALLWRGCVACWHPGSAILEERRRDPSARPSMLVGGSPEMRSPRPNGLGLSCVRPAWVLTRRCKSSGNLVAGTQGNRKVAPVRATLKEAGNEPASRRTGTGYEAVLRRASGQMTAKLSRPRRGAVNPAVVRGRPAVLPGEVSLAPERATPSRRREKSAAAIVAHGAKGQTERRAGRP